MQFFQFDKEGNMFIFAPGAGCTGPTKLVKPGDKLIFNSSYNPSNWTTESVATSQEEGDLLHTCLASAPSSGHEYNMPLPEEDLVELGHKNFSAETMKQIRWVWKMYREWRAHCHTIGL